MNESEPDSMRTCESLCSHAAIMSTNLQTTMKHKADADPVRGLIQTDRQRETRAGRDLAPSDKRVSSELGPEDSRVTMIQRDLVKAAGGSTDQLIQVRTDPIGTRSQTGSEQTPRKADQHKLQKKTYEDLCPLWTLTWCESECL